MRSVRTVAVDAGLGLVLGVAAVVAAHGRSVWRDGASSGWDGSGPPWAGGSPPDWGQVSLGWGVWVGVALLVLAVAVRRVRPPVALVAAGAGAGVFLVGAGAVGPVVVVMGALVVFSAAIRMEAGRFLAWALPLVVGAGVLSRAGRPWWGLVDGSLWAAVAVAVGVMAPWAGAGVFVRARRQGRAREREAEVARHRYEERLRIAREVHDLVGHSLSVISMQAGVALHVVDRRPEQAAVALAAIRDSSRSALEELRRTLAVFRGEEGAVLEPVAGLDRLEGVVEEMGRAGLAVEVGRVGEAVPLPGAVDHALLRIAQEGLTNVLRHAGAGATARVEVVFEAGRVCLSVVDTGPGPGVGWREGAGIAGMRERARGVGGELEAGPGERGGFVVRVWVPVEGDG
ncbi:sensor histidine kinase [Nocardiopsis sp. CC223A]|uniref:sensor histidine kinase n=1 Tax=Nocardiopsis sp. CC223A TaxID=3044051 RepID=UPI00278C7AF0|nr:sensor histidine kinase [Nocardiopsis sp. CC223A]